MLSLLVPGFGQIYNGAFLRGIFWLVVTPGFWIGSGGTIGWVCHLVAAYTAYRYAERALLSVPARSASIPGGQSIRVGSVATSHHDA